MAVEDVINATKEKLEAVLAPIDGGAGADISYDEGFEKVKSEVEKMTSMSGGKTDWNVIIATSEELLGEKGKDFRVALYYAAARVNTEGVAGLLAGFVVLSELITNFWETILLDAHSYGGGAFRPHLELNSKTPLKRGHFDRWLYLWAQTVDELFAGERAELAKAHATRVAAAFEARLRAFDSGGRELPPDGHELPLIS